MGKLPEENPPESITSEMLEKFRNLLSMDEECNWYFDDKPIEHENTIRFLNENLDRHPEDGRLIVNAGNAWSYVRYADAPYLVKAIRDRKIDGGKSPERIELILSDGSLEDLDPATLTVGDRNVLYCRVKGGSEEARFSRQAYYQLAGHIRESGENFAVEVNGRLYPIGTRDKVPGDPALQERQSPR